MSRRAVLAGLAAGAAPAALAQSLGSGSGVDDLRMGRGSPSDPFFSSVVLLLHFDGSLLDSSSAGHTITGSMPLTSSDQKWGTGSLNSGTNTLGSADSADWTFGAGQFTVECWARRTAAPPASGFSVFVAQWSGSANLGWVFRMSTTDLQFYISTTGTDFPGVTGTYTPPLNTWVHLAADRDASNVLRVYANGVVIASGATPGTVFDSTFSLTFGNDNGGLRNFNGQIDDLRITKGMARYSGAFTPPIGSFPNQ